MLLCSTPKLGCNPFVTINLLLIFLTVLLNSLLPLVCLEILTTLFDVIILLLLSL